MDLLFRESCRPNHSGLAKPTRPLLCYSWAQEWGGQLLEILAAADIVLFISWKASFLDLQ